MYRVAFRLLIPKFMDIFTGNDPWLQCLSSVRRRTCSPVMLVAKRFGVDGQRSITTKLPYEHKRATLSQLLLSFAGTQPDELGWDLGKA